MKTQLIFARILAPIITFFMSFQLLHAQEIGLELYSLRNQLKTDVPGTLAKIKNWNIKELEGSANYGLPVDEFKKLLAQNNLKMVSIGAEFDQLAKNVQPIIND